MMFSFAPILVILMLFCGGGRGGAELLDLANTDSYWQIKNITPTLDQLQADAGPDKAPTNIAAVLKDLESADFAVRDKAKQSLEQMGPAIAPQLKPAADSKDIEVAAVASDLLKRFAEHGQERAIRRLMAIRTLGEHKEKAALPFLKTLLDSRELFVSDYALRAIAQIEGNPFSPVDHQKEFARDAALFSKSTAILGQMKMAGSPDLTLNKLVDTAIDSMVARNDAALPPGGPPNPGQKPLDKKQIQLAMTKRILMVVEHAGNVRFEGLSYAVNDKIGKDDGAVTLVIRGKYDHALVYATLAELTKGMMHEEFDPATGVATTLPAVATAKPGEVPELNLGSEGVLFFPSDDQVVVVMGDPPGQKAELVTVRAALKAGKGDLAANADMAALLKQVDPKSPLWTVARLTKDMQISFLEPFDTIILESREKAGVLNYTITAEGADAEKVKAAADGVSADVATAVTQGQQQVARQKSMQPMLDAVMSIKIAANAKKATLTGEMKPGVVDAMLTELGGSGILVMMLGEMGLGMEERMAPMQVDPIAPAELPPAPPAP